MTDKDHALPKPPHKAFGGKKRFEEDQSTLIADRMAAAMANGKLDEFIKQELPDNVYARNLTSMMMGMTGMLPMENGPAAPSSREVAFQPAPSEAVDIRPGEGMVQAEAVPEDVRRAIETGDVKGLKDILRREYLKRTPGADIDMGDKTAQPQTQPSGMPMIDKELIDAMIQIAQDNNVTLDWMILRAIKVYVEEYRKTGRL
jgi:hypothetical protein